MSENRSENNCLPHRILNLKDKYIKSFWKKVENTGEDSCWKWKGYKNRQGYGRIGIATSQCVNAHRVSWVIHNGQIPNGMFVCHKCDNPECTNPRHLFIGSRQDNTNDMMIKKRSKHFQNTDFYGVRYEERYDGSNRQGRYRSFICKNEKIIYINTHVSALEAARNYDRISYIVFGERERLNFPEEYNINHWS
jgi:HNH endonuclease